MKRFLSICILILLINLLTAQVSKTINVSTAGSLSSLLQLSEKATITDLTITGDIDARDIKCIRDEIRSLAILDLSEANINEYIGSNGTSSVTNYSANKMPDHSFWNSNTGSKITLKTIKLPNSINSIGNMVFIGCTGLANVTIPNSVTSIGIGAFSSCTGLLSITIPNSVLTIGDNAFDSCTSLTSLIIGESVTTIGTMAFLGCNGLTSVLISNSVKVIGDYAFTNCSKLTSLIIPNSVESIGESAFSNCSVLSNLTIGSSVSTIGSNAFSNCSNLKIIRSLNINPPVLGSSTFDNSYLSVTNVYVPASSVDVYKSATGWYYYFYPIISEDNSVSAVTELKNIRTKVHNTTSEIIIDGTLEGESLTLYTLNGTHIQNIISKGERISLRVVRNTVYLVKTEEKTFKVIL